jgi:hypothetical protein
LASGLAIVVGHNVWSRRLLPDRHHAVGWSQLLARDRLAAAPAETQVAFFQLMRLEDFFYLYAGISLAIGAYSRSPASRPKSGN